MLVLLIVEIVSTAYYRLIRSHCGDDPIREMCRLILRDEAGHITFHRERLTARYPTGAPSLWSLGFFGLGTACVTFLWLSHGRWLKPLGIPASELFVFSLQGLRHFRRRLRRDEPQAGTHDFPNPRATTSSLSIR